MSELYFRRKEQLSNSVQKSNVVDANIELQKKRASSPIPQRSNSVVPSEKKLAYKHDLEDLKKKIDAVHNEISMAVASHKADTNAQIMDLSHKVESINKSMEATKYESLKNDMKQSLDKMNTSVRSVCDEMINMQDKVNVLSSKVAEFSEMCE